MKKTAVVFWSGTGNTESMANAVLEGMKAAGAEAELFTSEQADAAKLALFDAIAFGCPAMGAEELEETEFAPMFDAVKGSLSGKDAALFGSYGWGDGDAHLGGRLQGKWHEAGLRQRHLLRSARRRGGGKLPQAWRRAGKIK